MVLTRKVLCDRFANGFLLNSKYARCIVGRCTSVPVIIIALPQLKSSMQLALLSHQRLSQPNFTYHESTNGHVSAHEKKSPPSRHQLIGSTIDTINTTIDSNVTIPICTPASTHETLDSNPLRHRSWSLMFLDKNIKVDVVQHIH
jgi:hypothetical protein